MADSTTVARVASKSSSSEVLGRDQRCNRPKARHCSEEKKSDRITRPLRICETHQAVRLEDGSSSSS